MKKLYVNTKIPVLAVRGMGAFKVSQSDMSIEVSPHVAKVLLRRFPDLLSETPTVTPEPTRAKKHVESVVEKQEDSE